MPTDTRRITGPESSKSPHDFCPRKVLKLDAANIQRPDGRSSEKMRPIFLRAGVVSQARGSAYIEMNLTKVICAVYGPREVQRREDFSLQGQLTCDLKFAPFSCRYRRQHQQDSQEKDLSLQLLEALEPAVCLHKYPKSQINVYVTVMENDGGALCSAIICASLALSTAGIEMYDLVLASSAAVLSTGCVMVDPTTEEEEVILNKMAETKGDNKSAGIVTVAYLPSINQVSAMTSDGEVDLPTLNKTSKLCISNCEKLYPVLHKSLVSFLHDKNPETKKMAVD